MYAVSKITLAQWSSGFSCIAMNSSYIIQLDKETIQIPLVWVMFYFNLVLVGYVYNKFITMGMQALVKLF